MAFEPDEAEPLILADAESDDLSPIEFDAPSEAMEPGAEISDDADRTSDPAGSTASGCPEEIVVQVSFLLAAEAGDGFNKRTCGNHGFEARRGRVRGSAARD